MILLQHMIYVADGDDDDHDDDHDVDDAIHVPPVSISQKKSLYLRMMKEGVTTFSCSSHLM